MNAMMARAMLMSGPNVCLPLSLTGRMSWLVQMTGSRVSHGAGLLIKTATGKSVVALMKSLTGPFRNQLALPRKCPLAVAAQRTLIRITWSTIQMNGYRTRVPKLRER